LPELKTLHLSKTRISSSGFKQLARLPNLQTLNARSSKFSAEALEALAGSKTLERIEAQQSKLTVVDVQNFRKKHPAAKFQILIESRER
jgi:hypothetical protein